MRARRATGFAIVPLPIPRRKYLATSVPRAWRRGARPVPQGEFHRARRSSSAAGRPRRNVDPFDSFAHGGLARPSARADPLSAPIRGAGAGAGPSGRATYRDRRVSCAGRARLDGPPAAMQPTVGRAASSPVVPSASRLAYPRTVACAGYSVPKENETRQTR